MLDLKVSLHLLEGGKGVVPQEGGHGHHNAGGTEPTLTPMTVGQSESDLQGGLQKVQKLNELRLQNQLIIYL